MRRGEEGDGGEGDGQRWMGLAGRRTTVDGGQGGRGEGLIAREIREQREREHQLLIQRQQASSNDVTSPCRDDVSVTSYPETEARRDNDVIVPCRSRMAHDSRVAAERKEELQKVLCRCYAVTFLYLKLF